MSQECFVIDSKASRFTVKAVASGMSGGMGHNPTIGIHEFAGEVRFVPETLADASLTMKIKSASLAVEDDITKEDRRTLERIMHDQVLSTSRHPQVSFDSGDVRSVRLGPGLYKVELTGRLTLNGVTRVQIVSSQVTISPYSLRATGNFEIHQSDFAIAPINVAGGLLTLKDELKFAFFIVARQDGASENSRAEDTARSPITH
jgi:polyisoprenoid-binding protein YceI